MLRCKRFERQGIAFRYGDSYRRSHQAAPLGWEWVGYSRCSGNQYTKRKNKRGKSNHSVLYSVKEKACRWAGLAYSFS